jgi:prohibitin 2
MPDKRYPQTGLFPIDDAPKLIIKSAAYLIAGLFILNLVLDTFYSIPAGSRGVLVTFGQVDMQAKEPGLHVKAPFIQEVKITSVQTRKYQSDAAAASKDLQVVSATIAINYHLVPELVPVIYQNLGGSYETNIIQPLEQESVKAITAQFTAEELITRREEVREKIRDLLKEKLGPRYIQVEDISITNFDFSPSFNQAIEAKVTAEQNALASKNKLEQIKYEAQQRIEQARGEAEAIKIQADAIRVQGGADYVRLQAINKWNGALPTYNGGGVLPFIQVN